MKKILLTLITLCCTTTAMAQSMLQQLMPRPAEATPTSGVFTGRIADATVNIVSDAQLGTFNYKVEGFANEGYRLSVDANAITITAASEVGVIRAKQTLRQLVSSIDGRDVSTPEAAQSAAIDFSDIDALDAATVTIEGCQITDYPAFKVRGFMHDVGRAYISMEELKREIDLLARFKVNMFHWHLTDNYGFRFESKLHPEVHTKGFTRFVGKYYSQDECREFNQYARERGVIVIPEIDMPGHSQSFETATGVTMYSDKGKQILKDILTEVAACFPGAPYIHIGGDETDKATAAYVREMSDYVRNQGKEAACWNTYGPAQQKLVDPEAMGIGLVTNWATSGRLVKGCPNVDMRYFYVNHFDVFADLAGAYRSLVLEAERGNENIGGISVGIWNDRYIADEARIIAENNLYATVMACNERAWVGGEVDGNHHLYIEKCGAYLPNDGWEYDEYADWERRFLYYRDKWLADEPIPYVRSANVRWNITPAYDNGGDVSRTFDPETPGAELTPQPGSTYATGAGQWLNHIWSSTVTGVLGAQGFNQTRYAWTYVYSPKDQEVGAQIEFRNYSRSDAGLAPQNGKWDIMGSRVWVNDEELLPTWKWTNAGTNPGASKELGNLNFASREPLKVQLHEGWNKVLLKCPYVNIGGGNGNRPNKWQYTFVFTTLDGKHAVEGLVYSPKKMMEGEDFTNPKYEPVYPTASTELEHYYYSLATPLREGYYVTSSGLSTAMTSLASPADASYWRFEKRDATKEGEEAVYDIINYKDGGYISPTATNNNPIKCVKTRPTKGWTLAPAQTDGYFIIYSGTTQLNQTTNSHQRQLFNWGYNTSVANGYNISDQGCQFLIKENEELRYISPLVGLGTVLRDEAASSVTATYDLQGRPVSAALRSRQISITRGRKVIK